jgi:hypothetical protein
MSQETLTEKQDSIKISKNSKGYTWEVKRYYDFENTKPAEIISQIEDINKQLSLKFGSD